MAILRARRCGSRVPRRCLREGQEEVGTSTVEGIGANVTGTYASSTGGLGSVSGTVSSDIVNFTITVTTPGCSGSFTGTGNVDIPPVGNLTQSFSYSGSSTCGGTESGTGILTLQ